MTDGWQRLDPRTLATQPFAIAAKSLVPALAGFVGVGSAIGFGLALPLTVAGVVAVGAIPWLTTTYRITGTHLEVRRGLLNRTTVTARLDRVRSVDLEADVFHRVLRVTKVAVGTGVDESRLDLDSLDVDEAERLRVALLHGSPDAVSAGASDAVAPAPGSPAQEIAGLDWSWLRFAPLNIGNLAIALAAIGAVASQFDAFIDSERVESVWDWLQASDLPLVVGITLVAGLVLWVPAACVGYAVRWFGLRVTREQGKEGPTLRRVHGLFTQRATTVEEAKVRGVVVRRSALVGLAGGADLRVLTTGLADNEPHVLPSSPRAVVESVAADVLGDAEALVAPATPHGRRARRRALFHHLRQALYAVLAAVVLTWALGTWGVDRPLWLPPTVAVAAVPVALVAAELRYRRLGHALTEHYLVSCTGTLTATRTALEADGIVGWRLRQSFWDRRLGLAQLTAATAAGGEQVLVADVPLGEAVAVAAAATPRMVEGFLPTEDWA
ncbi:putative membrane protein [Nocardioides terrae]|uniref:Putative membrane protein n=1 Tax=Nocardioides terrae TaxID=574651 RepID=A0A1I1E0X8_9ACTN|nr:PH domain-containing protein [Nocardioides terrae]SFB78493.1 putative membrane protein [Nocardioides terrae]